MESLTAPRPGNRAKIGGGISARFFVMLTGLGKPHWEKSVPAWAGNAPIPISDPRIKAGNMSGVIAAVFS
jgi:hypothetical protein